MFTRRAKTNHQDHKGHQENKGHQWRTTKAIRTVIWDHLETHWNPLETHKDHMWTHWDYLGLLVPFGDQPEPLGASLGPFGIWGATETILGPFGDRPTSKLQNWKTVKMQKPRRQWHADELSTPHYPSLVAKRELPNGGSFAYIHGWFEQINTWLPQ